MCFDLPVDVEYHSDFVHHLPLVQRRRRLLHRFHQSLQQQEELLEVLEHDDVFEATDNHDNV